MIQKQQKSLFITIIFGLLTWFGAQAIPQSWDPQQGANKVLGHISTFSLPQSLSFSYDLLKQCKTHMEKEGTLKRFPDLIAKFDVAYSPLLSSGQGADAWLGFIDLDAQEMRKALVEFHAFLTQFIAQNKRRLTRNEAIFIEKLFAVDELYLTHVYPDRLTVWDKALAGLHVAKEWAYKHPFVIGIPAVLLSYYAVRKTFEPAKQIPQKPIPPSDVIPPSTTTPAGAPPPASQPIPLTPQAITPQLSGASELGQGTGLPQAPEPPKPEAPKKKEPKPEEPQEEPYNSKKAVTSLDGLVTHVPSFTQKGAECSYAACYVASAMYFEAIGQSNPLFDRMKRDHDHFLKWKDPVIDHVKKHRIKQLETTWSNNVSVTDLKDVDPALMTALNNIKNPKKDESKERLEWLNAIKKLTQDQGLSIDELLNEEMGRKARYRLLETELFRVELKKHLILNKNEYRLRNWMREHSSKITYLMYQDLRAPENSELRKAFIEKKAGPFALKTYLILDRDYIAPPDDKTLAWIKDKDRQSLVLDLQREEIGNRGKRYLIENEAEFRKGLLTETYKGMPLQEFILAQEFDGLIDDAALDEWFKKNEARLKDQREKVKLAAQKEFQDSALDIQYELSKRKGELLKQRAMVGSELSEAEKNYQVAQKKNFPHASLYYKAQMGKITLKKDALDKDFAEIEQQLKAAREAPKEREISEEEIRKNLLKFELDGLPIKVVILRETGKMPAQIEDAKLLKWLKANIGITNELLQRIVIRELLAPTDEGKARRLAFLDKTYNGITLRAHLFKSIGTTPPEIEQMTCNDAQIIDWMSKNRALTFQALEEELTDEKNVLLRHELLGREVDGFKLVDTILYDIWSEKDNNELIKELGYTVSGDIDKNKSQIIKAGSLTEWLAQSHGEKTWQEYLISKARENEASADEIESCLIPAIVAQGIPLQDITIIGASNQLIPQESGLYPRVMTDDPRIIDRIKRLQNNKVPQVVILNLGYGYRGVHWIPVVFTNDGTVKMQVADTSGSDKRHDDAVRNLLKIFSMQNIPEPSMLEQFDILIGNIESTLHQEVFRDNRVKAAQVHLNRAILVGLRGYRKREESALVVVYKKDASARSFFDDKDDSFKTYYQLLASAYLDWYVAMNKPGQQVTISEVPVDPYKYSEEAGDRFLSLPIDFKQCPDLDSYIKKLEENPEFNALVRA